MAEIKGNMLYNDRCLLSRVTVLLLFVPLRPRVAHLDGRKTLVFESSSRRWMWALRRGTSLCLVLCSMIYSFAPHVFGSGLWASTCADVCHVPTHRGFTLEEVAESRVEKGGLDGAENSCRSQYRSTNIGMNIEEEGTSLFFKQFLSSD